MCGRYGAGCRYSAGIAVAGAYHADTIEGPELLQTEETPVGWDFQTKLRKSFLFCSIYYIVGTNKFGRYPPPHPCTYLSLASRQRKVGCGVRFSRAPVTCMHTKKLQANGTSNKGTLLGEAEPPFQPININRFM